MSWRRPVFAANWKMHHGPSEATAFIRTFLSEIGTCADRTLVFFPSAASISSVVDALGERREILVGTQNIHWEDKGAFTGETSAPIASDAGARLVLVGHSERRHVFGETDEQTALKCAAAVRAGLVPMLCVGETLEQREAGETEAVVLRQLVAGLAGLNGGVGHSFMIAYEPVWAIGTGRTATPEDAAAVHAVIRDALRGALGDGAAAVPILYGGSVNRGNVGALLAAREVDGVLVGGASLDAQGWASIVRS
ncbi:MAG TPA: triose-phosphate isomerase [Gemmatimonadaceae bacterium]|nr:triose-phosphate isomerase [Gemmatimonadaceae bacterium]